MAKRKSSKKSATAAVAVFVNFLRGREIDSVVEFAKALVANAKPSLNKGVMSVTAWTKHVSDRAAAIKAGKKASPPINIYQPVVMQHANNVGAIMAYTPDPPAKRRPGKWNDNQLGQWEGGELDSPRLHHEQDVKDLIVNPDENVVKVGRLGEFLVGNGETSAIHLVHMSKTGGFRNIHRATKEAGDTENIKGVDRLVAHINSKIVTMTLEDGSELVWLPGQVLTWGYLHRGNNSQPMTPTQVRGIGEDAEGVTFKALESPIRLENCDPMKVAARVSKIMSAADTKDAEGATDWDRFVARKPRGEGKKSRDPLERVMENAGTCCRINPKVIRCNGLRALQIGLPIFTCFEGSIEQPKVRIAVAVGARLPVGFSENVWAFRARLNPKETKVSAEGEDAPKGKKSGKKGGAKKGGKKDAAVTSAPAADTVEDTKSEQTQDAEVAAAAGS